MKYLQRSFSSPPASDAYRDNHAATFGEQRKVCGWCQDTGLVPSVEPSPGRPVVIAEIEPCPKGCEAPGG